MRTKGGMARSKMSVYLQGILKLKVRIIRVGRRTALLTSLDALIKQRAGSPSLMQVISREQNLREFGKQAAVLHGQVVLIRQILVCKRSALDLKFLEPLFGQIKELCVEGSFPSFGNVKAHERLDEGNAGG